jgi:adenylate kinase
VRLVFLGPPGAGKGTQGALLSERQGVEILVSGDLLREAVRNGDPIGREVARCMKQGALVPDSMITELILARLGPLGPGETFVLDGFPRTESQAKVLDDFLTQRGQPGVDRAVDFKISAESIIRRLAGRRVCRGCGATYHLRNLPPWQPGICDRCGDQLKTRSDDDPATIGNRLEVYHRETEPVLSFYRAQGKLRAVSGELDIEEQYEALLALLRQEGLM